MTNGLGFTLRAWKCGAVDSTPDSGGSNSEGCDSNDDEGSNSTGGAGREDVAAAGVVSLPDFPVKRYCWRKPAQLKFVRSTKNWEVTKGAEKESKFRTLPGNFTLKSTP